MIITRTGEAVEFQLTETRQVAIDASRVASASQVVDRTAGGKLTNALLLIMDQGDAPVRVEASAAQVAVMHDRLAEIMSETTGPELVSRNIRPKGHERSLG
jgi:hypothetical protein